MIPSWLNELNAFAWVGSNVLVGYITVALVAFVIVYYALFDPKATTAGRFIFRFVVSLIGVIGLIFISLFIDPRAGTSWHIYPGDAVWWRPGLRFIVYGYVSYAITTLIALLVVRKWWPHLVATAEDKKLVRLRNETEEDNGDS